MEILVLILSPNELLKVSRSAYLPINPAPRLQVVVSGGGEGVGESH